MRTLLIDNYDSFTFNLFQLLATVQGEEPVVVRNDQSTWEELSTLVFDNIVISPGPGTPERPADVGICRDALRHARVPVLGVCLGHQTLAWEHGGAIRHAPDPVHGRRSAIFHDGSELWTGIPQGFQAVRYHSLVVDRSLPAALARTAWTEDELVMALRHRHLPQWGVQFHPESICTEFGARLLENFRDETLRRGARGRSRPSTPPAPRAAAPPLRCAPRLRAHVRRAAIELAPESIFLSAFAGQSLAFWLDSSRAETGLSRFSFLGGGGGPNAALVTYDASLGQVTEERPGSVRTRSESIYSFLDRELRDRLSEPPDLPFDFCGGYVGFFGYELKRENGASHRHRSRYPDASFIFVDRFVAFDHQTGATYLVALTDPDDVTTAEAWFDELERALRTPSPPRPPSTDEAPIELRLRRPRARYLQDIERCKRYIADGESYELCLTNQVHTAPLPSPLDTYLTLRQVNPAPYSAFLDLRDVVVMSSSPERYLRIGRDRTVESKPIKGTRARGATAGEDARLAAELATSPKDRAENLMIVDLLRNDLGSVCEIGSVHVPALMTVESYPTVHQLVSTIRGRLHPGASPLDCIRAAFPGGSMTGAPKLRALSILDELEDEARGAYAGAIGYLSLTGTADLNIVIRTIIATARETTIGVGGAVVAMSDPDDEFEETLLKARAPIRAVIESRRPRGQAPSCDDVLQQLRTRGVARV